MTEEIRIRLSSGETVVIRVAADDAHWRQKALANLDPLCPLAFAIRRAPHTAAERAAWDEYSRRQDLLDEIHALALAVDGLGAALQDLGGVA